MLARSLVGLFFALCHCAALANAVRGYIGNWTGAVTQPGAPGYAVELHIWPIDAQTLGGLAYYPELKCGGVLTQHSADAFSVRFNEKVVHGGGCADGQVLLSRGITGTLDWKWFYANNQIAAQAVVSRSGVSAEMTRLISAHRQSPQAPPATAARTEPQGTPAANGHGDQQALQRAAQQAASQARPQSTPSASSAPSSPASGSHYGEQRAKLSRDFLALKASSIATGDDLCALAGCEQICQELPNSCPGGAKASMFRGWWAKCSRQGWRDKNCEVIIKRVGKLSQSAPVVVPDQFQGLYAALNQGQAFALTENNLAFTSGLGKFLLDKCQILESADAAVLQQFAKSGLSFAMAGNDYMNPGKNINKAGQGVASLKLGIQLGESLACRMPESYILGKGIVASIKLSEGSRDNTPSRFVSTCSAQFSSPQCSCLADTGRAVIPDIHTRTYHRNLIAEIIKRNPVLAMAIPFKCRINNY